MVKLFRLILAAVGMLGMVSCYVSSVNPLPKESAADSSLLGLWESIPEKDVQASGKGYLLFMEDQNGMLDVSMFEDNFKLSEHYRGFCSVIDGEKFLNMKAVKASADGLHVETSDEYYIVRYAAAGSDEVDIQMLNEEFFRSEVAHKRLGGQKTVNSNDPVVLSSPTESLLAFFKENQALSQFYRQGRIRIRRIDRVPR